MTVLLDSNTLTAMVVGDHVHHGVADEWLANRTDSFATCPITQGALLRFLIRQGGSVDQAIEALDGVSANPRHEFWADDIPYEPAFLTGIVGHRQVTDAYLVALARHHAASLATFDQGLAALHPRTAELISSA